MPSYQIIVNITELQRSKGVPQHKLENMTGLSTFYCKDGKRDNEPMIRKNNKDS